MWNPDIPESAEPRYVAIVNCLAADIGSGRLQDGERLPTHRELADHLGVAVGTVTRAYTEAERRGLVRGEVGRGTFVGAADRESVLLGVPDRPGSAFIDLSVNTPIYGADPDLGAALRALAGQADLTRLLRYHPHAGAARHRAAGAAWAQRYGLTPTADHVLVCAGAQHAVTVALATLAQPGDRVLTESLTFPGMRTLASLLHLRLEGIAMDDEGMRPDALEKALEHEGAAVLYCMPTVQNPTGGVLSEGRRREIVALARAHDVAIVEDDVHRLLVPDAPPPLAALAPERGYFIAGTSKAIAGALRIGYLVAPPTMVEHLARGIWATIWMATPLTAEIATMWIEDGTADRVVERRRREAAARQRLAHDILGHLRYRAQPQAFHLWLELPDPWRSEEFASAAARRGVRVAPAEAFAVGRAPVPHAVRVSLSGAENRDALATGLRTLAEILAGPPQPGPGIV
jgi:DNA-binding transcriptional MocR family regulator